MKEGTGAEIEAFLETWQQKIHDKELREFVKGLGQREDVDIKGLLKKMGEDAAAERKQREAAEAAGKKRRCRRTV